MYKWYGIEVAQFGKPTQFCGKVFTTLAVIKQHFPYAYIQDNGLVTVSHDPRKISRI